MTLTHKEVLQRYIVLKISSGQWKPGAIIPSENQLATKFRCSRITVHNSLLTLVNSGVLIGKKGKGYFVAETKDSCCQSYGASIGSTSAEVEILFTEKLEDYWPEYASRENISYHAISKKYFKEGILIAEQLTFLNKKYFNMIDLDSLEKSISKTIIGSGIVLSEGKMQIGVLKHTYFDKTAKSFGYNQNYPLEKNSFFAQGDWIENTLRITHPDYLKLFFSKQRS